MNYGTIIEFVKLEPLKKTLSVNLKVSLGYASNLTLTLVAREIPNSRKYM